MQTVGIGVLMSDTGEKARSLQHWADLGIIHAEPDTDKKGRGRYREFVVEPYFGERKWALVASGLNALRIPLGEVRAIVERLRLLWSPDWYGEEGITETVKMNRFRASPFYLALAGGGDVLLFTGISYKDGKTIINNSFLPPITDEILSPTSGKIVHPTGAEILGQFRNFMSEHPSAYCLNLTKAFAPLRGAGV
jgi:hypothetical protein